MLVARRDWTGASVKINNDVTDTELFCVGIGGISLNKQEAILADGKSD
jgi:hypothetical protein